VNIVIGVRMNAGERKMDNTREREKECRKGRYSKIMYVSFSEREEKIKAKTNMCLRKRTKDMQHKIMC
jgi:hypothetical protein